MYRDVKRWGSHLDMRKYPFPFLFNSVAYPGFPLGRRNLIFCQICAKPSEIEKIQHIVFLQRLSIFLFKEKKQYSRPFLNEYNIFQLQEVDISGNKLQDLAGLKGLSNLTVSFLLPCYSKFSFTLQICASIEQSYHFLDKTNILFN